MKSLTIKKKLIIACAGITLIPILILSILLLQQIRTTAFNSFITSTDKELQQIDRGFTFFIDGVKGTVKLLASSSIVRRAEEPVPNYVKTTSSKLITPQEAGPYNTELFEFLKTAHQSNNNHVEAYLGDKFGGFTSSSPSPMPSGYDARKRAWYADTANGSSIKVTPAYMTMTTQKPVLGVVSPFKDLNGQTAGVVGVDVSLDGATNLIKNIKLGKTGYVILVQGDGTILANPRNPDSNFKKMQDMNIAAYSELNNKNKGALETELDGDRYLATIHSSATLGYKFIGLIKKSEVMAEANKLSTILIIISVALVAIFCFLGLLLANSITNPLKRTAALLKDIAEGEGDLTKRLSLTSKDELGEVAQWFDAFIEKLHEMVKQIGASATNIGSSSNNLSKISEDLLTNSGDTSQRATNVATASEEMSANLNNVAAAMEQSSTNTNMVATAAEEMSSTINEIAENAEKARTVSLDAVQQAEDASNSMAELGTAADKIGKVTETITEISEQTHLLALNATIEAARAGEAGKGFAVVANEIKELAKQTAEATLDIKTLIEDVQHTTNTAGSGIKRITEVIGGVNETVGSIATAVEEQTATTREIAENIAQASQGIQEVNENVTQSSVVASEITQDITEVSSASQNIAGSSKEVENNAQELLSNTNQLNTIVGKFKV